MSIINDNCDNLNTEVFNQKTALTLFEASDTERFPVNFDSAWQWLGYSRKNNAKRSFLEFGFIENTDYIIDCSFMSDLSTTAISSPSDKAHLMRNEVIKLTVDCLKIWGMMAGTEQGRQIRKYFLECEAIAKETVKQKALTQTQGKQKRVALPNKEIIENFENILRIEREFGNEQSVASVKRRFDKYITSTIGCDVPEFKPTLDPEKEKIFQDLVKVCKGESIRISDIRSHSLIRRKDCRMLYGSVSDKYLRKDGIIKLFKDAAKNGFGKFERFVNMFHPNK